MDTSQLNAIITAPGFLGAVPYDELPKQPNLKLFSLVINTSPSSEPGDHWLALVYQSPFYYFLDSYGRNLQDATFTQDFVRTMKSYIGHVKVVYQKKLLQQLMSNVCGDYCIYFISELAKKSFNRVMSVFSANLKSNDSYVLKYVKDLQI